MNTEYLGSASYDPADNKLRLRPNARLSKPDYERARAAGLIWAPKQELFVAPMWTPDREDLLLEWCGEIGDEDTSLVERAEERADRFEDYSENRKQDAESAHEAVLAIADGIPFGQPILVGHHSEKRARKDAERIENRMRKAITMWDQSQYWQQRAKGTIRHAKYKERPDVRARRIKGIEADKRKQERHKAEAVRGLKFWEGGFKLKHRETDETRPLEIIEENRERICAFLGSDSELGYLPVVKQEGERSGGSWHAWDVLRPDGERYAACPSCTVAECQEAARRHYPRLIERYDRWITHYENRLCYERAMLESDGGTIPENNGTPIEEKPTAPNTYKAPARTAFDDMRDSLKAGVQVVSAPQLFPTPPELAKRVIELAEIDPGVTVLEPSAGTGNLVKAIRESVDTEVVGVEVNRELCRHLEKRFESFELQVRNADFLTCNGDLGKFDRIVMNPPFANGADIKHILHALTFLNPGGRLVAICANGPRQQAALMPQAEQWIELEDAFVEAGTNVRTAIAVFTP